jgi:hypothetical protein
VTGPQASPGCRLHNLNYHLNLITYIFRAANQVPSKKREGDVLYALSLLEISASKHLEVLTEPGPVGPEPMCHHC